jgi:ppGpp synthetase/RelA/SpoT-type nucleotidyltranferase
VPRSLSTNQIDRLGRRIRDAGLIPAQDRLLLEQLRADHFHATAELQRRLRDHIGVQTTSRVKAPETIVAKLQRQPSLHLSRMQDIGGLRIVQDITRTQQDTLRDRIVAEVATGASVTDRRTDPRHGYRAIHIVTSAEGCRCEIQVRTKLQDLWAEVMEWLADRWGRQMRYGEPPTSPEAPIVSDSPVTRADMYASLRSLADQIAAHEEAVDDADQAELALGEQASEDARARVALTRAELQAGRNEILSVFEPMIQAGVISGRAG